MPFSCPFFGALESCSNSPKTGSKSLSATGCYPLLKEATQQLTMANKGYFSVRGSCGVTQQAGGNGCARLQRASASSGVAAPLGCVIFFASAEIEICTSCAQGLSACARQGRYHYPRCAPRAAETLYGRLSKRLTCRFLRLPSSTPCAVTFSANMQISLSVISVANAFALWYDKSQIRIFRR